MSCKWHFITEKWKKENGILRTNEWLRYNRKVNKKVCVSIAIEVVAYIKGAHKPQCVISTLNKMDFRSVDHIRASVLSMINEINDWSRRRSITNEGSKITDVLQFLWYIIHRRLQLLAEIYLWWYDI